MTAGSEHRTGDEPEAAGIRAAEYVRMSTEHQQYSTENQADILRSYAAARGIEIVRTYADEGRSGLRIDGRDALKALISDVESGGADFEVILVYDVSRWGRFQDADESAYYEYICKRAGIAVHYCAEQFENDGSPVSTIVKGVKRAMAGEYSRELSSKVFIGQCRLIELGFRQGGPPGLGLRRMLVDQGGNQKAVLARGEQKSLQTDRVVLTLGPDAEIDVVRRIYRLFVHDAQAEAQIAEALNAQGVLTDLGRQWTRGTVHQILINEKYLGNNVWNRVSFKLKKKRVRNEPEMWIRSDGVFPAVIERPLFDAAQTIIRARSIKLTDSEMLEALRSLFEQHGVLSGITIDEAEGVPSSSAYRARFGSLLRAYGLVGYRPRRDYRYIEINRVLRTMHPEVVADVIGSLRSWGSTVEQNPTNDLISVNGEFTAAIVIARCQQTQAGSYRWRLRFDTGLLPDVSIVVRMAANNRDPLDYYLLPSIDLRRDKLRLAEENGLALDAYRFESLDEFYEFVSPTHFAEAA
ncbi:MAG TPA: recombinase family protein [Devosia sp.]|jgi:DNA invertase Pin-like site-specific DNA recombinase|uniref:recombinase family protein n=1 Tax=Devosia sp. TaxID=1871048 RepID=UPI002DDCDCE4|nr:recombinase family protein [Devosia sp.]HEV2515156.1 recombinase family protein [Devosia sp.]